MSTTRTPWQRFAGYGRTERRHSAGSLRGLLMVAVMAAGCGDAQEGSDPGPGVNGGAGNRGGTDAAGGRDASGGKVGSETAGVPSASGGHPVGSGGALSGSGGTPSGSGGSQVARGGTLTGSGGVPASGGSDTGRGGRVGSGGSASTGGANPSGGASSSGGSASTGGANPSGGASSSGGASTGGATATGGAVGTGGSSACGALIPPLEGTCPTFSTGTVTVAGLSGISLQVGPRSEGTGSLLFYWHGTGSTASEVNTLMPSAVRQEILAQGGIIVAFQGSVGTGGDCSGTSTFSKDDFSVADLIAACAVRDHHIDPCRIYTTGCSAGGLQSGCMAAMRSSYIAAAVPNSGGEVTQQPIQDASHIPAVMTMHGGATDVVIVSFATTSATFDSHMKSAGGFVVNCDHGGGHCQAPAALYTAGWEFMKAHPYGVAPEPYTPGLPASFPEYCGVY